MLRVDVKLDGNDYSVIEIDNIIQDRLPFLRRMSETQEKVDTINEVSINNI